MLRLRGTSACHATRAIALAAAATERPRVDRGGQVQEASLRGGTFTVRQTPTRRPSTQLRLIGGDSSACDVQGRALISGEVRHLSTTIGKRKGKWQVRGRYSLASAEGTSWLTEDRCDGTLTRVVTGTVHVHDLARDRDVTVQAGESYLARP